MFIRKVWLGLLLVLLRIYSTICDYQKKHELMGMATGDKPVNLIIHRSKIPNINQFLSLCGKYAMRIGSHKNNAGYVNGFTIKGRMAFDQRLPSGVLYNR